MSIQDDEYARLQGKLHAQGVALHCIVKIIVPDPESRQRFLSRILSSEEGRLSKQELSPFGDVMAAAILQELEAIFK